MTDANGHPLPRVLVEVWVPGARAATRITDARGAFHFSTEQSHAANGLTLTHLGYHTLSVRITAADTLLRYRMDVLPLALSELTVAVAREACPTTDDPRARAIWLVARERYAATTSERGIRVSMLRAEEHLAPERRVGWIDETRLRPADVVYVGATVAPTAGRFQDVNARIAEAGYAERTGVERPAWRYPALDGRDAHHFRSDVFGERHTFTVHREGEAEVVLVFCPRERSRPAIEGTLVVGADSALRSASWRVWTPKPEEVAGGEVVFVPWAGGGDLRPHLLAARGLFWLRHGKWEDRYYQRSTIFTRWSVSEADTMPGRFLR